MKFTSRKQAEEKNTTFNTEGKNEVKLVNKEIIGSLRNQYEIARVNYMSKEEEAEEEVGEVEEEGINIDNDKYSRC